MTSGKPRKSRAALRSAPAHRASSWLRSPLSRELREQYGIRRVRVRVGDLVKVVRGDYKGVEGKVIRVFPGQGRIAIEGLTRQNSRGENVPVRVHSSKVVVTKLNLDDRLRREALEARAKEAEGS